MDRFDQEQIEKDRESFAIRSSLIVMDFERMLEKVKQIEMQLMDFQEYPQDPQVSKDDFFKPDDESQTALPAKKKMRI